MKERKSKKPKVVLTPIERNLKSAAIGYPDIIAARIKELGIESWEAICTMKLGEFSEFLGRLSMSVEDSQRFAIYWSCQRKETINGKVTPPPTVTSNQHQLNKRTLDCLESITKGDLSSQKKQCSNECSEFKFRPWQEMATFEANGDENIPTRILSLQTIFLWGGQWFSVQVVNEVDSLLLVKRMCLYSGEVESIATDLMCPEYEWILRDSIRLLYRRKPATNYEDSPDDLEFLNQKNSLGLEEPVDGGEENISEEEVQENGVKENTELEDASKSKEDNGKAANDNLSEEEEEIENVVEVDLDDQFRFPLKFSTSRDVKKPLHLRRVQLFWPHCEEWFSGTVRLQPNRKYMVDYDDGDKEYLSASYLTTHRFVHLLPFDPLVQTVDEETIVPKKKRLAPEPVIEPVIPPDESINQEEIEGGDGSIEQIEPEPLLASCVESKAGWQIIHFPSIERFVSRIKFNHAWCVLGHFFTRHHAKSALVNILHRVPQLKLCDIDPDLGMSTETSDLDDTHIEAPVRVPDWLTSLLTSTSKLDSQLNLLRNMSLLPPCLSRSTTASEDSKLDITSSRSKLLRKKQRESLELSRKLQQRFQEDRLKQEEDPRLKKEASQKNSLVFPKSCASFASYAIVRVDTSFAQALTEVYQLIDASLEGEFKEGMLHLCSQLASDVSAIYLLIAGQGAPHIHLTRDEPRPATSSSMKQLKNAALRLRQILGSEDTSTALWEHSAKHGNSMVSFAPNSRAFRRYVNTGQTGNYNSFLKGGFKCIDVPEHVNVKLDVVAACVRGEIHDDDLRFATEITMIKDARSELFGENEVVATRDIRPGELGPYAGVLLRDDEVLQHLGARPRPFLRALHFWYSVLFDGATASAVESDFGSLSTAIDTFSLFPFLGNEMSLVNDYAGPDRSEYNKSQRPPPNCKYQVVKSNGWPYVFVMATRHIKRGEPLRADYGDAFWETWRAVVAMEQSIDTSSRVIFEALDAIEG